MQKGDNQTCVLFLFLRLQFKSLLTLKKNIIMKMNRSISKKIKTLLIITILQFAVSLVINGQQKTIKDIKVDGYLDEDYWFTANKFENFIQIEPDIFAPSEVKSELYFTYDSDNIYFGGVLFQQRETISAVNARKDDPNLTESDCIIIGIDPLNNGNSAFFFVINPVNAIGDGVIDVTGNLDFSWDAVFTSATKIQDDFWSIEVKIPLTSISFQNKESQQWGLMFSRRYAHNQELSINQLVDENTPYRVSDFDKVDGINNLMKSKKIVIVPYLYGHGKYSLNNNSYFFDGKFGGEIKYNPTPSATILTTINPDYAQIETDKEIINTSDLPTTYPEKRLFFTESSDMYPGLAVNTRNISDINVGLKYRRVGKISKIDLTSVYDKERNLWGLGNLRITDNKRYHFEVITGVKSQNTNYLNDYDYNVTMHGKIYLFNKQMQVYTWYGTINMHEGGKNEYESVNAIKWISRRWNAGIWNQYKSDLYNPNIVGSPALSNEIIVEGWLGYCWYYESGFFRKISLTSNLKRFDLYNKTGNDYYKSINKFSSLFNLGNEIGNWELTFVYNPNISQYFRFRSKEQFAAKEVHNDAISDFVLIEQSSHSFNINLKTDLSKSIGAEFNFDNSLIRKSKANNYNFESFLKIGSKTLIAYSFYYIEILGSDYQDNYNQIINRVKAEYNINDKTNLRFIYQPNKITQPLDGYLNQNYVFNFTFSWEFLPGGNFYIVYNKLRNYDKYSNGVENYIENSHNLVVKVSKSF